ERGEFDQVEALLKGIDAPAARRELLLARRERARLQDDGAVHLASTKELIKDFPNDAAYASWVASLAETEPASAALLKDAVAQSVARWSGNAALGASDFSEGDLAYEQGDIAAAIGSTDEAKGFYSKAADLYGEEAKKSPLALPRAANLGRGDALLKAGRKDEAKALYEKLVKAYPAEFTFNYEYAAALDENGDFATAYPYAAKAAEVGYGDNWLRAMRLKGALELKLGRKAEAAKTVDEALAQIVPPKSSQVRTYRYVAALRDLSGKIASAKD